MTIQDIKNILTIIEEKSINKAAARLFVSQPALSKCVKKVEQEYSITLFQRSRGSALTLTEEGRCFLEMARGMEQCQKLFETQLTQIRSENRKNILFASPMQRAYSLSGPVMKWIYDNHPDYSMDLKTISSQDMAGALRSGAVDIALTGRKLGDESLYMREVFRTQNYLYVYPGCPAAERARTVEGLPYPVIALSDLVGETVVANLPGTGSRIVLEEILAKAGILLPIRDESAYALRIAMVDAGHAITVTSGDSLATDRRFDTSRIFCLSPEEDVESIDWLLCRRGFQNDSRYQIIFEALQYVTRSPFPVKE